MASEEPLERDTLFRKLRAKSENKVLNLGLWFVIFFFSFLPLASIIIIIIRLAAAVAAALTCVCTCPNFIVRLLTFT